MKVLVIGSGGREHALVLKLKDSPRVQKIFCAPGNAGIGEHAECVSIKADDIPGLLTLVQNEKIDLTVVGPELPLTLGIVDVFRRNNLAIFGPTKEAAILEGSKVFTKEFCLRHNIPTAKAATFDDVNEALAYLDTQKMPLVIKADGLAAGKGVLICNDHENARKAVKDIMVDKTFGEAGCKVVIEEFLEGEEASFIAISDGKTVLPLATSQDHKRAYDNDKGPNTGGMGAYSPAPVITEALYEKIMQTIVLPTVRGMAQEGREFCGVLYAGVMVRNDEPYLLEINCRFGDPETQPIMMRFKSDLLDVIESAINKDLKGMHIEWDPRSAVCVVLAAGGYPGIYEKGKVINGLDETSSMADVIVYHAGTKKRNNDYLTDGGRVLGVTALGKTISDAISNVYGAIEKISWEGMFCRRDIGKKAVNAGN